MSESQKWRASSLKRNFVEAVCSTLDHVNGAKVLVDARAGTASFIDARNRRAGMTSCSCWLAGAAIVLSESRIKALHTSALPLADGFPPTVDHILSLLPVNW
jgi:hypothetical protein